MFFRHDAGGLLTIESTRTLENFKLQVVYVLSTYQYILVYTIFCITYQYVLSTYQYIQVCTKYPDFFPEHPVTISDVGQLVKSSICLD